MTSEICPKCHKELTILQSSDRRICRSCGWTDKPRQIAVDSSLKGKISQKIIGLAMLIGIPGAYIVSTTSPDFVYNSEPALDSRNPEYTRNPTSSEDTKDFTSPEYTRTVIERSGIGETIDSVEEMIRACTVMAQDQGLSYSQAYDYCN